MSGEQGPGIEWVASDDASTTSAVLDRQGPGRTRLALVGLAGVALVGLAVLSGRSSSAPPADAAPTTTTEAPVAETVPARPAVATDTAMPAAAVADLGAVAALDVPLELVVTSPTSGEARLVSIGDGGEISVVALPRLSDLSFDASGNWLAGVSYTRHGEQRRILWAGRVGRDLEPVAVGLRSFAWHDTAPGVVAWIEAGSTTVTSLDLRGTAEPELTDLPVGGLLQGWGEWGHALQASPRAPTTTVVDADGRVVALDHPGRYAAHLPGRGIVVSGGGAPPGVIDVVSGASRPIEGLDAGDRVWAMTSTSDGERLLVIPATRRAATPGSLVALDGDAVEGLAVTPAVTGLASTPERGRVTFVNQSTPDGTTAATIAVLAGDEITEAPVPDLFSGREWVVAIAERSDPAIS